MAGPLSLSGWRNHLFTRYGLLGPCHLQLKRRHYVFWADDFNDDFVRGIMSTMPFEPLEGLNDIPSYLTARDLERSLLLGLFLDALPITGLCRLRLCLPLGRSPPDLPGLPLRTLKCRLPARLPTVSLACMPRKKARLAAFEKTGAGARSPQALSVRAPLAFPGGVYRNLGKAIGGDCSRKSRPGRGVRLLLRAKRTLSEHS